MLNYCVVCVVLVYLVRYGCFIYVDDLVGYVCLMLYCFGCGILLWML